MNTRIIRNKRDELQVNIFRVLCILCFPFIIYLITDYGLNLIATVIFSLIALSGLFLSLKISIMLDSNKMIILKQRFLNLANTKSIFKVEDIEFIEYGLIKSVRAGTYTYLPYVSYTETLRIQMKNGHNKKFLLKLTHNDKIEIEKSLNLKIKPIR